MLSGATRGGGGRALGAHLADRKRENVATVMGETRHLGPSSIEEALRELDEGAAHGRTRQHAYHLHADPAPGERWTAATWDDWWDRLEQRLGLEDAPFVEARHTTWREAPEGADLDRLREVHGADAVRLRDQDGRTEVLIEHRHRVYSRVREDGSVVPLRHDYAAREAVARQIEHDHGFAFRIGGHNRAVAAAMRREGRHDVAEAMQAAGLIEAPRPVADLTPKARAQQERTGLPQAEVDRRILAAWRAGDSPAAKAAALRDAALTPVMGTKGPGVLDEAGGFHLLTKAVGRASKKDGARIGAAEVRAALEGLDLPHYVGEAGRRPRRDAAPADQAEAPQPVEEPEDRADTAALDESLSTQEAASGAADLTWEEQAAPAVPEPMIAAPVPPMGESAPVEVAAPAPQVEAPSQAPAAAPAKGGAAPSAGGGGAAPGGGADELVRPWDGTDKDWPRFMAAFARAEQAKRAKAGAAEDAARRSAAPTMTEEDHEWIRELAQRIATRFERSPAADRVERAQAAWRTGAARAAVERRPDQAGARRDGGPGAGDGGAPGHPRQEGPQPRALGDAPSGRDGRGPARAAVPSGPAPAGRGEPARPDRRALGEGRGEPDPHGAAAGRARIRTRRALRGLAAAAAPRASRLAALTAVLAAPPTAASLAYEALQADRSRARAVLATEPHRDPRSRTVDGARSELRDAVFERQRRAEARAAQAARRADEARARLRLRDRILPTADAREARILVEQAARLRDDAELGRESTGDDVRAADARAPYVAAARRREHDAWERRPDVLDAKRREQANRLIENRIHRGDRALEARVAGGNLDGAQRQVIDEQRQVEERCHRERKEKIQCEILAPFSGPRR